MPFDPSKKTAIHTLALLLCLVMPCFTLAQGAALEKSVADLMEEARVALSTSEYDVAINLYTRVIARDDLQYQMLALEYLGVAREKNGQLAHAKAIYEQFLEKYPLDKSASRVRQRLNALITAASKPKEKLRQIEKKPARERMEWSGFGGFSQYYRHYDLKVEDDISDRETDIDIESSLSSDLFYSVRGRNSSWDLEFRLGAGYLNDFLADSDDEDRLSELYADIEHSDTGHALRIGRQRGNNAGVLSRFDGIQTSFQLSDSYQLNLLYGFPVETTNDVSINDDKKLYGINLDAGPFGGWEFTPFYVEQRVDSLLERKAAGLETRYFDQSKTLFTLIDYDIEFEEINNILAIGSWRLSSATTITTNIDLRKSPLLLISNALQGQSEESIEELHKRFDEDELRKIAADRSADSTLISTGVNHRLNQRWTLYSSVTMTRLSSMPASAGVAELDGTGNEWSYDVQFISSGLIKEYDTGICSLRYFDGSRSQRTTANLDFRYPLNQNLRISPRMRIDFRKNTDNDTEQWIYKPSLRMTYRHHKKYHFEFELGGEWSDRQLSGNNEEKSQGLFGTVGYRIDL